MKSIVKAKEIRIEDDLDYLNSIIRILNPLWPARWDNSTTPTPLLWKEGIKELVNNEVTATNKKLHYTKQEFHNEKEESLNGNKHSPLTKGRCKRGWSNR